MSNISKQALLVENNQSFPNNTAGLITPTGLRTFNENMIDSNVNQTVYTADSASFDTRIDALSGSVAPSTGSLLTTASFDNGTRNLTFTKGDSSTFAVNIPDITGSQLPAGLVSGSSQIDYPGISNIPSGIVSGSSQLTGSFVTLTGGQTITGPKTFQQASGGSINAVEMFDTSKIQFGGFATTRIGATGGKNLVIESTNNDGTNTINIVAGVSGTSSGGANTIVIQALGNQVGNNLTLRSTDIIISGSTNISGSLSHSLQEGFVLVGDSSGRTTNVATSSFGTNLNTGSFATTGSNTFIGNQTITGSLEVSETIKSQVYINPQIIDGFTIPTNNNAMLVGPIAVSGSIVLEGNSNLVVLSQVTSSLPSGVVSGSSQLTASYDVRYALSGSGGGTIDTGSFATTGSNIFIGNQTITGSLFVSSSDVVTFIVPSFGGAPAPGGLSVTGSMAVNGNFAVNGGNFVVGQVNTPKIVGTGTGLQIVSDVKIFNDGNINNPRVLGISGSVFVSQSINVGEALALTPNDPLPANGVGKLAVSGSSLFFNDGSNWILIV